MDTVAKPPIGTKVVVNEEFDPNNGKEGMVIDHMVQQPNPDRYWGTLVRFEDGSARWYRDANLEIANAE